MHVFHADKTCVLCFCHLRPGTLDQGTSGHVQERDAGEDPKITTGVKTILEIAIMLTLQEWQQTQSSKNCIFIKAHEHSTILFFSKNTL